MDFDNEIAKYKLHLPNGLWGVCYEGGRHLATRSAILLQRASSLAREAGRSTQHEYRN
jgi:hypothetical protein